jgi:outer membrane lipoprotein-sorting protein
MLAMLPATGLGAETLEEVGRKLDESHAKLKAYTAKAKITQNMEMAGMGKYESDAEFTIEWLRRGDQALMRQDGRTSVTAPGMAGKTDTAITMISDGKFVYTVSEVLSGEQKGQKMAMKNAAPQDKSEFRQMLDTDQFTFKLLPDETVDGQECFVLEAREKAPQAGSPMNRSVDYFRKDTGIAVKMLGYNAEDKTVFTTTVSDIKLNADLKPERFEFKAPEGVEVMDMTKMQQPQPESGAPPSDAKADEPSKPPEPKADEPKSEKKDEKKEDKKPKIPGLPKLKKP